MIGGAVVGDELVLSKETNGNFLSIVWQFFLIAGGAVKSDCFTTAVVGANVLLRSTEDLSLCFIVRSGLL